MEIEKLLEIVRNIHGQAYELGYKHGKQAAILEQIIGRNNN